MHSCLSILPPTPLTSDQTLVAFGKRCRRKRQGEIGDGQCGKRAIGRQLCANRGEHLRPVQGAIQLTHIKEVNELVGNSLITNADTLAATIYPVGFGDNESKMASKRKRESVNIKARGEAMKVAGPGPCFDMAEWFGGVGGTDSTALAIEVNEIAYVMTQGSNDVVLHHCGDPDVCAPRTHARTRTRGLKRARGHVIGCNSGVVHARAHARRTRARPKGRYLGVVYAQARAVDAC